MNKVTHKFHAKPTSVDNIRFASKLEAKYYQYLLNLQAAGDVVGFLRQTPLHFKSGVKYVMDFLVFYADGSCVAVDVKGVETPEFKLKKKLIDIEYAWLDLIIIKTF